MYVKELKLHDYSEVLFSELLSVIEQHNLQEQNQISLTSVEGNDDWTCSIGSILDLPHREKLYSTINKLLVGTHIHYLIEENKHYYSW